MKIKRYWQDNKEKIKDWFIIQRIRLLNFIKEHKYLSTGIGVFLLTCVVVLVAFANDDPYAGKIIVNDVSVTPHLQDNTNKTTQIQSFSTLIYKIDYNLQVKEGENFEGNLYRNIVIEATLNDGIDAIWINSEDSADISSDGKTMSIVVGGVPVGQNHSNSKDLYLSVQNVANNLEIIPTIKIKEETALDDDFKIINKKDNNGNLVNEDSAIKVSTISEEIQLIPNFTWGLPYKYNEAGLIGRNIPFGVILGIDKNLSNIDSLQGKYINPTQTFNITLSQSLDQLEKNSKGIELRQNEFDESGNIKKEYYGLYNRNENIFVPKNNMPHFKYDYNQISVFDSGNITNIEPLTINKNKHIYETVFSPVLALTGSKHIILTSVDEYVEEGIKIKIGDEYENLCLGNESDNCTLTVEGPEDGDLYDENKKTGIYKIKYTYTTDNDSDKVNEYVTLYRTVEVIDEVIEKVEYIKTNDKYDIPKNSSIFQGKTKVTEIDTTKEGTYKIIDEEGKIIYLVISDELIATPLGFAGDSEVSYLYFNEEAGVSPSKTEYFDSNGNKVDSIDNLENYIIRYTYSEKDKFDIAIESNARVETVESDSKNVYKVTVSGIKTNGLFYNYKNENENYLALGSYYFTAKSPRTEAEGDKNIYVNLTVLSNSETGVPNGEVGSIINSNYSDGTVENKIFTQKEEDDDEWNFSNINSNEFIYGETLILNSETSYGIDGDDAINEINTQIDLNSLKLDISDNKLNYSAEVFVNGVLEKELSSNVEIICYDSAGETCTDYNNARVIEYKIKNVQPGTTVKFKIRAAVKSGVKSGDYELTSVTKYKEKETESNCVLTITPFKAKTRLFIDDYEQDIIVNGNEKTNSTLAIHPYISLPAQLTNTYAAGIKNVDATISLTLPDKVSYVYNDNYIKPTTINGKVLTYELKDVNLNEWLDAIYVDVDYDVSISSGSDLEFSVTIDATDDETGLKDLSSKDERTTTRTVTYQNNDIAHGQSVSSSTISKDGSFDVTTKIFNNKTETITGLKLITILPYNDVNNSDYIGDYKISNLKENALCTVDSPSLVEKELGKENTVKWVSCKEYEEDNYYGVTAFKYEIDSIASKNEYSYVVKYNTSDNGADDKYVIKSYLIHDGKEISEKKSTVSVMSKKITGVVWEDFDSNGIMDLDENKISGVTLRLIDADTNEEIDEDISDEDGIYKLIVPSEGNYYVIAEYNIDKYGISPIRTDMTDKSLISSFSTDNSSIISPISDEENSEDSEFEDDGDIDEDNDIDEDDDDFDEDDDDFDEDDEDSEDQDNNPVIRTQVIEFTNETKAVNNVNLGLTIKKNYKVKISKYITKVVTTNNLGISNTKDYGNTTFAKLDVKDINNLKIKVVYTFELENTGYYPGYIYMVKDFIPDGMTFNKNYEENKGWQLNEEFGYLQNATLSDELIYEGEKKYLTLALEITRKEAGSFVNYAVVDDDDLQILGSENEEGSETYE